MNDEVATSSTCVLKLKIFLCSVLLSIIATRTTSSKSAAVVLSANVLIVKQPQERGY